MDAHIAARSLEADEVRAFLKAHPELLRDDGALLTALGLRPAAANVVEFGPAALARVHAAHKRETKARKSLEATAQANFSAQAQTHGAVIDLLDARNHADLARRVDDLAQLRFGLAAGVVALEGPQATPAGWKALGPGQIDQVVGHQQVARMGVVPTALGLFGPGAGEIASVALVRLAIWEPARSGLLAFGSAHPDGFSEDMGTELVAFLGRVVERTAERWPVL